LPHPSLPKLKTQKKEGTLSAFLGLPIGWHEISFLKRVGHRFWSGLTIPLAKNTIPIDLSSPV